MSVQIDPKLQPIVCRKKQQKLTYASRALLPISYFCVCMAGSFFLLNKDFSQFMVFRYGTTLSSIQKAIPVVIKYAIYFSCLILMFMPKLSISDELIFLFAGCCSIEDQIRSYVHRFVIFPWWAQCSLLVAGTVFRVIGIVFHFWVTKMDQK